MYTLKCMPSTPMTQAEMERQCRITAKAAQLMEEYGISEQNERTIMIDLSTDEMWVK